MSGDKIVPALEQFVLLAKTARGAAAVELIQQVLDAPGVYVFSELLDMPHIKELAEGEHASALNLLNLFAFGTYTDYANNKSDLPELSLNQVKKLRHLTIVSMATKNKCLPYSLLLSELHMKNLRELEDLIIEAVYSDIIRGKLDQQHQQLEVDYAIGRDIRPDSVTGIISVLQEWCTSCEAVLRGIETQIVKANTYKENQYRTKSRMDEEISNIKKTLKSTQQQDMDETMVTDSREVAASSSDKPKKTPKAKGLRGSGKLWGKSS